MLLATVRGRAWKGVHLLIPLLLTGVAPASADTLNAGCMEEVAGFDLNCTANDVQVARALNIEILDDGCAYPGDDVTFSANFEVVLTAQERHDIGIYFATDGDQDMDGALTGMCTVATVPYAPEPDYLDLDGTGDGGMCQNDPNREVVSSCTSNRHCKTVGGACGPYVQDACGDIDGAHNPLLPAITLTTKCIDPDGDGNLNLPNCTSWRQPGANGLCLDPLDAFPGSPSKCRCDTAFQVPILVPPPILSVEKTADPTSLNEPGGTVVFSVRVTNPSPFASVTLTGFADDEDDDGTDDVSYDPAAICDTTFLLPGASTDCSFTRLVTGNGGDAITDVVTVSGVDSENRSVESSDDATVTLVDLLPAISVHKTADPTEVLEPGADVTFNVRVVNQSSIGDPVTIDMLVDSIYGDLDGTGSCTVPQTIEPGKSYSCSFTAFVAGNAGDMEVDVVTAEGADDEGNPVMASDSATVNVNDVPSMIELEKTATPTTLSEPGGDVTFGFTVSNRSSVDVVTIESLVDSIYGDLDGRGDCSVPQTLVPSASYSCSFVTLVSGNASDVETNVATASGRDDDGNPVSDDDDASVNIRNVEPSAWLSKTATMADVTFEVVVTNTSNAADPLLLSSLEDDVYGDVTQVGGDLRSTTCAVPQTLAPGASYRCSFVGRVSAPGHTDTVTATLSDDDGSSPLSPSDSASVGLP